MALLTAGKLLASRMGSLRLEGTPNHEPDSNVFMLVDLP